MGHEAPRQVALNLVLGAEASRSIEALRARLRDAGLPVSGVPAHVSVAVVEGEPAALAGAFTGPPPATLQLVHLGAFPGPPGVVFAGVAPTTDLVLLHERTWAALAGLGRGWARYQPGCWVPHCTLAMPLERRDLGRAITVLVDADLPFLADIAAMTVADLETATTLFTTWPP